MLNPKNIDIVGTTSPPPPTPAALAKEIKEARTIIPMISFI